MNEPTEPIVIFHFDPHRAGVCMFESQLTRTTERLKEWAAHETRGDRQKLKERFVREWESYLIFELGFWRSDAANGSIIDWMRRKYRENMQHIGRRLTQLHYADLALMDALTKEMAQRAQAQTVSDHPTRPVWRRRHCTI